jgi:hypothetical protein
MHIPVKGGKRGEQPGNLNAFKHDLLDDYLRQKLKSPDVQMHLA